jgi:pseudouridine-5'-phosphate glycosidase
VVLVCSGAKAVLDLPATMEVLETLGVAVVGWGTRELPAFWSSESGIRLGRAVADAPEAAAAWRAARGLGVPGAMVVCVPPPSELALPPAEAEAAVERALAEAVDRGLSGGAVTPFLLARVAELTGGRSLAANRALLERNAGVAAEIAVALAATAGRDA